MAIQRNKVVQSAAPVVESVPQTIDANAPVAGPTAVPDVEASTVQAKASGRRGRPAGGAQGPHLSWGLVVNGEVLQKTLVEVAREVNTAHNGYATLDDLVTALKAHSVFTDNVTADGSATLADLVTPLNVRNQWNAMRDKFVIQFSAKPVEEGGLGLQIPSVEDFKTAGAWKKAARALFTDGQWARMEDAIARPRPEGRDFPKLVVRRGRRSNGGLNIDDI